MDADAPDRRAVLRALAAGGLGPLGACAAGPEPTLSVPDAALVDEPLDVAVEGLESGARAVVRASAQSSDGVEWASHAAFEADGDGTIPVADRAPLEGTYEGADPAGLLWSMRPAYATPGEPLPPRALFAPPPAGYDVTLSVEVDGEAVASATTRRRLHDPAVEARPVDHPDLVGTLFLPPDGGPAPGVVHLHGAGGEPFEPTARLLASRGFATLALQYFGAPAPLPDNLVEVPVEYVETAVGWLRDRPGVAGGDVGLFGFSRGVALALLAATRADAVGAVVGWVGSGVVWEGLGPGYSPAGTSAWSIGGEPVAYLGWRARDLGDPPTASRPIYEGALERATGGDLATATVPVERADAPVHLVSATDDARWPSTALSARVVDRLDERGSPREHRHEAHEGAGHFLTFPHRPTPGTTRDRLRVYGGSPAANARANAGAWSGSLSVLDRALGRS